MAKLAAFMANKGTFEGKTLISEKTWEDMHSEPVVEQHWPWAMTDKQTKGGIGLWGLDGIKDHPKNTELASLA
jgi:hypothetical protein